MGQVLHGSATTTDAVRRAIQHSQASLRTLAIRYGINQRTVRYGKSDAIAHPPSLARQPPVGNPLPDTSEPVNPLG
jgi:hypothetical protein